MSLLALAGHRTTPVRHQHHFRLSGGGVVVVQSWPEHIARATEAIRRRRAGESRVLSPEGEWC